MQHWLQGFFKSWTIEYSKRPLTKDLNPEWAFEREGLVFTDNWAAFLKRHHINNLSWPSQSPNGLFFFVLPGSCKTWHNLQFASRGNELSVEMKKLISILQAHKNNFAERQTIFLKNEYEEENNTTKQCSYEVSSWITFSMRDNQRPHRNILQNCVWQISRSEMPPYKHEQKQSTRD